MKPDQEKNSQASNDSGDAVVVNCPSPDVPVLVNGPAMSASIWENVGSPTTKGMKAPYWSNYTPHNEVFIHIWQDGLLCLVDVHT